MTAPTNPWKLSTRECQMLDALIVHGRDKETGRAIGISPRTVQSHLYAVAAKMGEPSRVRMAVLWDRFRAGRT